MIQIEEKKKHITISLENDDLIEVWQRKYNQKIRIICKSNKLYFENITYKELIDMKEEKEAIKSMEKHLKKQFSTNHAKYRHNKYNNVDKKR